METLESPTEPASYFFSDQPEKDFSRTASKENTRKLGQYFTPYPVAKFMAGWVNQAKSLKCVLDPAAGLGIFFRALLEINADYSGIFFGYEIDPLVHDQITRLFSRFPAVNICLRSENFLFTEDSRQYDGILCNPPYIRYKRIAGREILIDKIEEEIGIQVNPQSNIYAYFIIRGARALAPQGRAAFLVPSEFLNSEFGIPIKEYLISRKLLKQVLLFDSRDSIFADSITTSCILLMVNNQIAEPIQFARLNSPEELADLTKSFAGSTNRVNQLTFISNPKISPAEKWSGYYNHLALQKKPERLVPLSQIGRVLRGIATGDNRFFTFTDSKIERYAIPNKCLLPCLTRSSQSRQPFFTHTCYDELAQADMPVYLLDANRDLPNPSIQAYLNLGQATGSHRRFLTRNRDPWYRLENRPPAPILAATFSRQNLRFIRNEAAVYNLTCFHSIYLLQEFESKTDLLMAYLLTPFAHVLIGRNRREYGNGLIKYEPNDLKTALVIDLNQIGPSLEDKALSLYREYRLSNLDNHPDLALIDQLDDLFTRWAAG